MKPFYAALLDVYKEIEKDMEKEGYQYRHHYAKEAVKHFVFLSNIILYGHIYCEA